MRRPYKLENRLFKHGVLAPVCVGCGLRSWLDQPIPLELDHLASLRLTGARDAPLGLARDCSHRSERWCWFPEFDPIHTGRFRAGCSNYFKSLASTYFATRASSARGIVCYVVGGRGRCWRATLPRGSFRYTLRR